ncbi:hypothetical protein [Clostridium nigeriense]|uniref:hypothetical protein n=1 Tax=Clostridium nigeriense TaxID=1805470 RepID=UPI000834246F|nr:hypothetical protein [Clostridium nigeriense]
MNKKLFLKLGLLLLSLSLVSCGQKNNSPVEENPSKVSTSQSVSSTESSGEETKDEYYRIIKEVWQKQKDYIDSIDDPKLKQSIQTTQSAAIMESNRLLMEHPEDSEAIEASLKKVLSGE